jgi:hypothetical protein
MMRTLRRWSLFGLLVLNALLLPVSVLMLLGPVNPMLAMFVTEFAVENRTSERIRVTPVGTVESGSRRLLPVYLAPFPAVWGVRNRDFVIPPGVTVRIFYDWDDVLLSEIVVHDARGRAYQVSVDQSMPNRGFGPHQERFVIGDLGLLPGPGPEVLRVARSGFHNWRPWVVLLLSLAAWPSFRALRRAYHRARPS